MGVDFVFFFIEESLRIHFMKFNSVLPVFYD